jgi:hypothetical protein
LRRVHDEDLNVGWTALPSAQEATHAPTDREIIVDAINEFLQFSFLPFSSLVRRPDPITISLKCQYPDTKIRQFGGLNRASRQKSDWNRV